MITHFDDVKRVAPQSAPTALDTIPNPEAVRRLAAEIRRSWPPRERRRRAQLAQQMFLWELIGPRH
jgi:hypothetical protein